MIDYIERLVEDGKYDSAIECAERLMLSRENTAIDLAHIHCALLISRFQTQQYYAASVSGQLALRLARETEAWDTFGRCCLYLGVTQQKLGDLNLALSISLEFFNYIPCYSSATTLGPWVWYNIGVIHTKLKDPSAAISYLRRAQDSASEVGDTYLQHASRHATIEAYVLKGELREIPRLMAQSLRFLRQNADKPFATDSYLWHMLLRANYSLRRNRLDRAIAISMKALKRSENRYYQKFHFHMLLAGLCMNKGLVNEALGHSLSARLCAIKSNKYDFETQAMELIYQMTREVVLDSITISGEFIFQEAHVSLFDRASLH